MDDPVHHPRAGPAGARVRVLEEGQIGARRGVLVRVEEVVDGRIVLVDRFLDHPQPQHARVEIDVARRITGDRGDVVNAFELHAPTPPVVPRSTRCCTASASTSRCVTARTELGPTAPMRTPSASKSAQKRLASATPKMTMLVSTSPGSSVMPGSSRQPAGQRRRVRVVVGQPVDVVVERVQRARRDDARLAQCAAEHLLVAPRLLDQRGRARQEAPSGAPRPFVKSSQAVSKPAAISAAGTPDATTAFISRAPSMCSRRSGLLRDPDHARAAAPAATPGRPTCSSSARPTRAASAACSGLGRSQRAPHVVAREHAQRACPAGESSPPRTPPGPPASAMIGCERTVQDRLVPAGADVQPEGDLVAHRPGGQEHRRLHPSSAATRAHSSVTVGSSKRCSSPTSASAIALRMAGVGRVWVSE